MGAIEAFVIAAQRPTLREVSDELNLSPSAVSRRIKALESYLGQELFDRTGNEVHLTDDGAELLKRLTPALESIANAFITTPDRSNALRLGVPSLFCSHWLLPHMADFNSRFPDIVITFDTSPQPIGGIRDDVDAAILFTDQISELLYSRRLRREFAYLVCAPSLTSGTPPLQTPADIAHHKLLLLRGSDRLLTKWTAALGIPHVRPAAISYFDNGQLMMEAAANGLGLAFGIDFHSASFIDAGRLVRPFGERIPTEFNFFFACKHSALDNRTLKRFHDWIFRQFEQNL
jgi:LysR family glycine cleavage system transcriptional activator